MNSLIYDYIKRWVDGHRVYGKLPKYRQLKIIKYYYSLNQGEVKCQDKN